MQSTMHFLIQIIILNKLSYVDERQTYTLKLLKLGFRVLISNFKYGIKLKVWSEKINQ